MEFIKETIVAIFWKQISNHAHDYAIWPIAKKAVRKLDREMLFESTATFDPLYIRIRKFSLDTTLYPFESAFQPNLNRINPIFELKVMVQIRRHMQAGILVRIGLRFFFDSLFYLDSN